jgi:hypothetical protein
MLESWVGSWLPRSQKRDLGHPGRMRFVATFHT